MLLRIVYLIRCLAVKSFMLIINNDGDVTVPGWRPFSSWNISPCFSSLTSMKKLLFLIIFSIIFIKCFGNLSSINLFTRPSRKTQRKASEKLTNMLPTGYVYYLSKYIADIREQAYWAIAVWISWILAGFANCNYFRDLPIFWEIAVV